MAGSSGYIIQKAGNLISISAATDTGNPGTITKTDIISAATIQVHPALNSDGDPDASVQFVSIWPGMSGILVPASKLYTLSGQIGGDDLGVAATTDGIISLMSA